MWIVRKGLKAGERVVAQGQQSLRPGALVQPEPFKGSDDLKVIVKQPAISPQPFVGGNSKKICRLGISVC
jgi:hypothetical protein